MDIILNAVGKDCFGLIMEYAKMKDEFDMCITQIKKCGLVTDLFTSFYYYNDEYYFTEDAVEYYYPFVNDGNPNNSYVEFVYFMDHLKDYNEYDFKNYFPKSIFKTLKMIKKLKIEL